MTELLIDQAAFGRNLRAVAERVSPAEVMLVVKDDAYGLGLDNVIPTALAAGIMWIGSFDIASGLRVRALAGEAVRVFAWHAGDTSLVDHALAQQIELGVGNSTYLELVAARAAALGVTARVHLKIDTGLNRNGFRSELWPDAVVRSAELERTGRIDVVGIWTHIAEASDADDDLARVAFDAAIATAQAAGLKPSVRHLAASAAAWHRPEFRADLVRIGAFCYGVRSAHGPVIDAAPPAFSLRSRVIAVDGDHVTVDIGHLDGIPSNLAGRAHVGTPVGPRRVIAIDETTMTVAAWQDAAVGDAVLVFGPGVMGESSPTDLAELIDTIGEEILLRVSSAIPRTLVGG